MAGSLSGQGMIGVVVSVAQYFAALHSSRKSEAAHGDEDQSSSPDVLRLAALLFFICASVYAVFTLAFQYFVARTVPKYQHLAQLAAKLNREHSTPTSFFGVERKVRVLGMTVFLVFAVTISVFPAITANITSVRSGGSEPTSFFADSQFIAFGFLVFNSGDWIGRSLPSWPALRLGSTPKLLLCSCARIVFIVGTHLIAFAVTNLTHIS